MSKIGVTENVLRDGHQSLIATRMRTEHMLPICGELDAVGFWSLEVWGGATFDSCLRFLKEDPWERLRQLRNALPNTRLQMLLRGQNVLGYRHYADDIVRAFVEKSAANGIDVFRIFDALNDIRNMRVSIEAVKRTGKHAQGAICYTVSPVHDTERFVALATQFADMGCDSIAIKDMAGLLTPTATVQLVEGIRKAVSLPLAIHSHATAGISDMCQLKGVEAGATHIDTTISSFAGGASHAPTESMVVALRDTPYDTGLDLERLQKIAAYFKSVRKKYHQFESEGTGLDTRVHVFQIPGGMISNLYNQLREQNALERIDEVLDEVPRVREDLGFPPLVTPTSQIVGTQAVINVLTGGRYKTITNEVKHYLQGKYGATPAPVNEDLRRKAIGDAPLVEGRPADELQPELDQLRDQIGDLATSEEDVLIFAMFPEIGRQFLQARRDQKLIPEPLDPPEATPATGGAGTPTEFNITLHGESYHVKVTGAGLPNNQLRPFYLTVDGIPEEITVEALGEFTAPAKADQQTTETSGATTSRPRATAPGHVTSSMPGTIVDVLVNNGDRVNAGDALLIVEAMKMETEIQAPLAGTVASIYVAKGDRVTPDETLVEITQ